MSKSAIGVVVSVLLTIASTVAPVPDEHRMKIFIGTVGLMLLTCAWWLIAHRQESRGPQGERRRETGIRPKLVLQNQGVAINLDGGTCFFFTLKNVGPVVIKKADFSFVIQTTNLASPPVVQHEPTSQPIIEGTERTIRYNFPTVNPDSAYIAFYVSYIGEGHDAKWDNAPVFLIWRGVTKNVVHLELEYLRDEEINRFKEYLRKQEIPNALL